MFFLGFLAKLLEILHYTCGLHLWLTYSFVQGCSTPSVSALTSFAGSFKPGVETIPQCQLCGKRTPGMSSFHLQYCPRHKSDKRQMYMRIRNQAPGGISGKNFFGGAQVNSIFGSTCI